MTEAINRRIVLASRPKGQPTPENFRLEEAPLPEPGAGEILQPHDLSVARPLHARPG